MRMVVFFNAAVKMLPHLPGVDVLADPDATVYKALGTKRSSSYFALSRGQLGPALRSARQGRLPRATSADMLRLGADVAIAADGEIVTLHLATSPDDRVATGELLAAFAASGRGQS